jgi:biopolymer transport protein ExbB/TolQ
MFAQVPVYTINEQLTVVIAIVVCFILAGAAAKYAWDRIEKQSDKDRLWRETQNAKREAHEEKQAQSWQSVIDSIDQRREKGEESRQAAILKLAESVNGVSSDLKAHHEQAKTILTIAQRIDVNTTPGNGEEKRKPNGGRWGSVNGG